MHIFFISIQERSSTKNKVFHSLKRDFSPQHPGFTRKNGNFEGKYYARSCYFYYIITTLPHSH